MRGSASSRCGTGTALGAADGTGGAETILIRGASSSENGDCPVNRSARVVIVFITDYAPLTAGLHSCQSAPESAQTGILKGGGRPISGVPPLPRERGGRFRSGKAVRHNLAAECEYGFK